MDFVAKSVAGKILFGNKENFVYGIETDSRNIKQGDLFFALKGQVYDGHAFVLEALNKGAVAAVISELINYPRGSLTGKSLILVDDTLQALQRLAGSYRQRFDIPVVAVTGSVGKTTTKDIIALCLEPRFKTLKTYGNMNNEIGLPLTVLKLEKEHQAAVLELAMRAKGEIRRLAEIAQPTCAVISNIEAVHLENLKSLENIALSKCEVLEKLSTRHFAVINGDSDILLKIAEQYPCRKYTFGYKEDSDFRIVDVKVNNKGIDIKARLVDVVEDFHFPVPSLKLAGNVISAIAVAFMLGVEIDKIKSSLQEYKPSGYRLNMINFPEGGVIINDTYNANPVSMAAALETVKELRGQGKIVAVLGDMFELGKYEVPGHIEIGKKAAETGVDILLAIGERAKYIAQGALEAGMLPAQIHHFESKEDSIEYLTSIFEKKDTFLFKASRGMQMETLVEELIQREDIRRET